MYKVKPNSIEERLEKLEASMLVLAFIAVGFYMVDLLGFWQKWGLAETYKIVALIIDSIFVLNLVLKSFFVKFYFSSPWFIIDLISSIPILASISLLPGSVESLRFVRSFRLFRALRVLRMLNVIPLLQYDIKGRMDTPESKKFTKAMWILIPSYTLIFSLLVNWLHNHYPEEASILEFYLILGTMLGIIIAIIVTRYQIPAILSLHTNRLLNVALPRQVASHFLRHPEAYSHTVKMPASILFTDIKGFTKTVEGMENDLAALKYHLESVMSAITEVHLKYDLIIDKFIGDAIMSFRGGDLVSGSPKENAWAIVKAALETQKVIIAKNDRYFKDIKIGGASTETALIGAFGTPSRLSYTILGDKVNLAARLESAVKFCGTQNLFCQETYNLLKDDKDFIWRRFGKIQVEGKLVPIEIYEVFDAKDIQDMRWIEEFKSGLFLFENQDFEGAIECFEKASNLRPGGDVPSQVYISLCKKYAIEPLEEFETPVFKVAK